MDMKLRFFHSIILVTTLITACAPTPASTPTVDVIGTMSVELASMMLTQTVAAYSPTPPPSPTFTATPVFTETPALPPTPVETVMPKVLEAGGADVAPCYQGPGPNYPLTSQISSMKYVEMVGVGSVPGWYVIINPYFHSQCWIEARHLVLDPSFDVSAYPTVTR
jgi:hypothetical protein